MKKQLSGLLALLLLLSLCAGCGNSDEDKTPDDAPSSDSLISEKGIYYDVTGVEPQETVLEYQGNKIPAEMYFYWLGYTCSNIEYQINMMNAYNSGAYAESLNEDGSLKWDSELEGSTPSQMAKEGAESNTLSYAVLENMAAEYGVTVTDEDRADMESQLTQQMEQMGGEEAFQENLRQMGVTRETFDRISAASYLLAHLQKLVMDPDSALYAPPAEDDAYVDHILLATKDVDTGEALSEEAVAAKKEQADDLLAQLQAAEDLESLFSQLVEEYGEDPGRAASAGYLVNAQTSFVPEFLDAALALRPGELSGIVESDYGYHIIIRKELTEDQIASLAGQHLSDLLTSKMEGAMAEAVRSEKLDEIDAGSFYTSYMEIIKKVQEASQPSGTDGAGTDGAGTDGTDAGGTENGGGSQPAE